MHENYRRRMMAARDPRFAKIATRLGYGTRDMVAEREEPVEPAAELTPEPTPEPVNPAAAAAKPTKPEAPNEDIAAVRDEYERVVGKRPYHGWFIPTLRQKIAEAKDKS